MNWPLILTDVAVITVGVSVILTSLSCRKLHERAMRLEQMVRVLYGDLRD